MLVKNIMIPLEQLTTVSVQDTIGHALELIEGHKLLSLPVIDNKEFIGIISKKYIYEDYFSTQQDKETFLKQPVKNFMKTKIENVKERDLVEVPAHILSNNNLQFIPVINEKGNFTGIVTHKAIFKTFNKILGIGYTRIEIITRDVKGRLAYLAEVIAKQGANIISIAQIDVEVMNLREIILRVDSKNTKKLVDALNEAGFRVNRIDE